MKPNQVHKINLLTREQIENLSQSEQRSIEECPYKGVSGQMWRDGFVEGTRFAFDSFVILTQLTLLKYDTDKDGLRNLLERILELNGGRK